MKTLLLVFGCAFAAGFSGQAVPPAPPVTLAVHNGALFEKMAAGLEPSKLLRMYGAQFKVKSVATNRHDPTVRDSILVASTPVDRLELFKNPYNSFLIAAQITSSKIEFGRGIRIGSSQAAFCKAFHLKPGYPVYQITDAPEEVVQLRFAFFNGKLQKVTYRMVRPYTEID